jgi:tRNA pseudouridine38-40 synthase
VSTTWRLVIQYDGGAYCGWQEQPGGDSIQGRVREALTQVLGGDRPSLIASGRTDSGVHALGQVCSFRTERQRSPKAVRDGMNSNLPEDIGVLLAEPAHPDFHAQRSATGKLYRYRIRLGPGRPALRSGRIWSSRYALDVAAMQQALACIEGRHDFTSFRAAGCSARSPVRTVNRAQVREVEDELWVELHGEGFLRHMVRNVVGSLVEVGRGRRDPSWFRELLDQTDRKKAGRTAPSCGLYLVRVDYPSELLRS